jgi:hypothetical protein
MDIVPKAVTNPTAYAVSSRLAFMVGEIAAMAEFPQMAKPAPMRIEVFFETLRTLPSAIAPKKVVTTIVNTSTRPGNPILLICSKLILKPSSTMPILIRVLLANSAPKLNLLGRFVRLLKTNAMSNPIVSGLTSPIAVALKYATKVMARTKSKPVM